MNSAIVKIGQRGVTAPRPQLQTVTPSRSSPPSLVMRYPTMEERFAGYNIYVADWVKGGNKTHDQAILEASLALAAEREEAAQRETLRQQAERQAELDREMEARRWDAGGEWRVVGEVAPQQLLTGGREQAALRAGTHEAAIARRLLELQEERFVLLLPESVRCEPQGAELG